MPLITWSDDYLTGDETVDRQHQSLFALINELHEAIIAGRGREQVTPTLQKLGAYVATHFQTEERLMLDSGYPGYLVHKGKHDELTARAARIIDDYSSGRAVLTIALSRFLADWIRHHIHGEDQHMIRFFQERRRSNGG